MNTTTFASTMEPAMVTQPMYTYVLTMVVSVGLIMLRNVVFRVSTDEKTKSVARTALDEIKTGEFKRRDAAWRNWISQEQDAEFPPEAGRYHLYVAYACPWAHRTLMVLALKGLEDIITVTVVHPVWKKTRPEDKEDKHKGWVFGDPNSTETFVNTDGLGGPFPCAFPNNEPDPSPAKAKTIRELYEKAGDQDGKYTVPILWDKRKNTIVSNESSEIIQMLNSEFNEFAKNPHLDLAPKDMKQAMEEVNSLIYPNLNNGVYRCGFATTQTAYDAAITDLTNAFDQVESILSQQRYIAGNRFTLADIRLFVTLVRFDEVYVVYFKTNTRRVQDSPALLNYCREIYQMAGVADTVNMEQIKTHYYCSHPKLNPYSIIPRGMTGKSTYTAFLEEPHDRDAVYPKKM